MLSVGLTLAFSACIKGGTPTTRPATIIDPNIPPSFEELVKGGFSFPGIHRITCEALKQLMSTAESHGYGYLQEWDSFILVDTRSDLEFERERIPGAINIPNTLLDWLAGPSPAEIASWQYEQAALEEKLRWLPIDRPIVFYDGRADDAAAASLAQKLIGLGAGYDSLNINVLWRGFSRWSSELRYPTVQYEIG